MLCVCTCISIKYANKEASLERFLLSEAYHFSSSVHSVFGGCRLFDTCIEGRCCNWGLGLHNHVDSSILRLAEISLSDLVPVCGLFRFESTPWSGVNTHSMSIKELLSMNYTKQKKQQNNKTKTKQKNRHRKNIRQWFIIIVLPCYIGSLHCSMLRHFYHRHCSLRCYCSVKNIYLFTLIYTL